MWGTAFLHEWLSPGHYLTHCGLDRIKALTLLSTFILEQNKTGISQYSRTKTQNLIQTKTVGRNGAQEVLPIIPTVTSIRQDYCHKNNHRTIEAIIPKRKYKKRGNKSKRKQVSKFYDKIYFWKLYTLLNLFPAIPCNAKLLVKFGKNCSYNYNILPH